MHTCICNFVYTNIMHQYAYMYIYICKQKYTSCIDDIYLYFSIYLYIHNMGLKRRPPDPVNMFHSSRGNHWAFI